MPVADLTPARIRVLTKAEQSVNAGLIAAARAVHKDIRAFDKCLPSDTVTVEQLRMSLDDLERRILDAVVLGE